MQARWACNFSLSSPVRLNRPYTDAGPSGRLLPLRHDAPAGPFQSESLEFAAVHPAADAAKSRASGGGLPRQRRSRHARRGRTTSWSRTWWSSKVSIQQPRRAGQQPHDVDILFCAPPHSPGALVNWACRIDLRDGSRSALTRSRAPAKAWTWAPSESSSTSAEGRNPRLCGGRA